MKTTLWLMILLRNGIKKMINRVDVAVIGAGVTGAAVAYYLAREGLSVNIIERQAIASGASGYAVGVVNPLIGTGIPGPSQPLAEASFRMHQKLWPLLEDETGMDLQAKMMPHLQLCVTEKEVVNAQSEMDRWSSVDGFDVRWLENEEVRELEPRVADGVCGAVLLQNVGVLDSYRLTIALTLAAELYGAQLTFGRVLTLESDREGGHVLILEDDTISCNSVVIAMGPWSGEASDWLGIKIPVAPLKGEILHLQPPVPPLTHHIQGAGQILQKADGMLWVGTTEESVCFDLTRTEAARKDLMERALCVMPCLSSLSQVRHTACLRPVTPDRMPILGSVPGREGVYIATGAEKKGILLGPSMGKAIADLVIDGETTLPIDHFRMERFPE